jgi:DNA-binding transcriptional MerR regulator
MTSSLKNSRPSPSEDAARLYSIGDLSSEFDISPRAIRFYEDQGLLRPQRIGGNRVYTYKDRVRLILVLRGKRLGFSLADIKELLNLYDVDPEHREQLRTALAKGRLRIAELERQRTEITETLKELRELEAMALARLEEKEPHGDAPAPRKEGDPE